MKDETITGSTDSNGLFTAKNPYIHPCGKVKMYCRYKEPCSCFKHDDFKNYHPPLFCYNENNELVKGVEGLEVKGPVFQFLSDDWSSGKKIQTWVNGNDGDRPFPTYKSYSKYWNDRKFETRHVYIAVQPTGKAEKQSTGEKELYYCLSDNGDLNGLYLASMREVSEHIEMDLGDIEPSDLEKVQYTITPVFMTQEEFDNLPEYEG